MRVPRLPGDTSSGCCYFRSAVARGRLDVVVAQDLEVKGPGVAAAAFPGPEGFGDVAVDLDTGPGVDFREVVAGGDVAAR